MRKGFPGRVASLGKGWEGESAWFLGGQKRGWHSWSGVREEQGQRAQVPAGSPRVFLGAQVLVRPGRPWSLNRKLLSWEVCGAGSLQPLSHSGLSSSIAFPAGFLQASGLLSYSLFSYLSIFILTVLNTTFIFVPKFMYLARICF